MAYKGKYKLSNPSKYIGDPTKIIYRSLWEKSVMKFIEQDITVKKWASEVPIKYINDLDGKVHRYFIDFYIEYINGTILLMEVKPAKQCIAPKEPKRKTQRYINEVATYITNCSKWKAAKKICTQNGFNFEIWDEHVIKSKGIKIIA
jgi:hypothetical protein